MKKDITVNRMSVENQDPTCRLIQYYSSWNRLQRAVAWIMKVNKLLRLQSQKRKICLEDERVQDQSSNRSTLETIKLIKADTMQNLSVEEMEEAEEAVICFEQRRYFRQELGHLENNSVQKAPFTNWIQLLIKARSDKQKCNASTSEESNHPT